MSQVLRLTGRVSSDRDSDVTRLQVGEPEKAGADSEAQRHCEAAALVTVSRRGEAA